MRYESICSICCIELNPDTGVGEEERWMGIRWVAVCWGCTKCIPIPTSCLGLEKLAQRPFRPGYEGERRETQTRGARDTDRFN
jgi:hypothetical protein